MSEEWASPNAWRGSLGYPKYTPPTPEEASGTYLEKDMSLTTVLISVVGGALGGIIGRVITEWYKSKR